MNQPAKISFYNTPARTKQLFTPQRPGQVSLYTCGPTVYNYLHVGNWLAYIRWDTLVRSLRLSGYQVERVMNITDVGHLTGENEGDADQGEDKLEKGARRDGTTAWQVAQRYTDDFLAGMHSLALIMPEHITKATDYIPQQIALVKRLEAAGYTYPTRDGIYFDTAKFAAYADFAKLDLAALQEGARVSANPDKRQPSDFALWKFSPTGAKRDMEWDSPWGIGFPGWHLECSAMAMELLGETLDLHTGGIDHIPVHHTNEIAQSQAATGQPFVRYWLHTAHLLADGTKISKSLGNGYTLQDITQRGLSALDFKLFVLQSHYRTESNFSWQNLSAAAARRQHWREVASLRWQASGDASTEPGRIISLDLAAANDKLLAALRDDLDTPQALAAVDFAMNGLKKAPLTDLDPTALSTFIDQVDAALGLELAASTPQLAANALPLLDRRAQALEARDWSVSDQLRDRLRNEYAIGLRDLQSDGHKQQVWFWL